MSGDLAEVTHEVVKVRRVLRDMCVCDGRFGVNTGVASASKSEDEDRFRIALDSLEKNVDWTIVLFGSVGRIS